MGVMQNYFQEMQVEFGNRESKLLGYEGPMVGLSLRRTLETLALCIQ